MNRNLMLTYLLLILFIIILTFLIVTSCSSKEGFTAPGLTLINPPSWFPQNSSKHYNKKDWQSKMYLDRYPPKKGCNKYGSQKEAEKNASVFHFWRN